MLFYFCIADVNGELILNVIELSDLILFKSLDWA